MNGKRLLRNQSWPNRKYRGICLDHMTKITKLLIGDVLRDLNQAPPSEETCSLTADTPIRNMD